MYSLKRVDVALQHEGNICLIGQADLLPHDRGGGRDPCDVLEAPGGQTFHKLIRIVRVVHQVHKAGGDEMGKMADRGDRQIVFSVIQYQRDRADAARDPRHGFHRAGRRFRGGGENIVCVFQEVIRGILITCLF